MEAVGATHSALVVVQAENDYDDDVYQASRLKNSATDCHNKIQSCSKTGQYSEQKS